MSREEVEIRLRFTIKQETLVRTFIENGGNASDAYRAGYNTANLRPNSLNELAYRELKKPHVAAFVEELRASISEKSDVTIESVIRSLLEGQRGATADKKWAALARINELLGKHLGLFHEKPVTNVNVLNITESRPLARYTLDELDAMLERAKELESATVGSDNIRYVNDLQAQNSDAPALGDGNSNGVTPGEGDGATKPMHGSGSDSDSEVPF